VVNPSCFSSKFSHHLKVPDAARGICDPSADPAALAAQGAPLRNYEGLPCDAAPAAEPPGRATALKLRAGDAATW